MDAVLKASANARKEQGKQFLAFVDKRTPKMTKQLIRVRRSWVAQFWDAADTILPHPGTMQRADALSEDEQQPVYVDEFGAPLTVEEAAALQTIVAALVGDGYAQVVGDEMKLALSAGWLSGQDVITMAEDLTLDFGTVPTKTLDAIQDVAKRFAFLVNAREQKVLYGLIDNAIANGQTVRSLAAAIDDSFGQGYHILDDKGRVTTTVPTPYWSEMVARTELSRAQTAGQLAVYREAGVQTFIWQSNHGPTVCDECDDANGTVVRDGELFEGVEVDAPPAHPNCCCNLLPYDENVRSEYVLEKDAVDDAA